MSLLVDVDIDPLPANPNKVGLDLGISSLVTLSTGEKIANPKPFQTKYNRLRKAQKALSRQIKGSNTVLSLKRLR